ncbi:hypothetical protein [Ruegeria hyattellae]|uniref:hypothetical protein n=1 Tax=Ruegeria hyattellae TaxID=3233337 RepID=UPI00355C16A1
MTNVIALTTSTPKAPKAQQPRQSGTVVSIDDWRTNPHPVRTPNGVFFVTNMWGHSGDAA